jgi:hypothetical protein
MSHYRSNHRFNLSSQMNYLKISIGTVILALGMLGSAQASMIKGQLDFAGAATINRENGMFTSFDYLYDPFVVYATEDFATSIGHTVNADLDPINFLSLSLPETLWSVNGFSFSLQSLSINDGTTAGGTGIISHALFDDTEGFWSFTTQGNSDTDGTFGFSSTAMPSAVTVPAAVWLFGTALIGLVGFGKRRKSA